LFTGDFTVACGGLLAGAADSADMGTGATTGDGDFIGDEGFIGDG
jgi:hypothetical protein